MTTKMRKGRIKNKARRRRLTNVKGVGQRPQPITPSSNPALVTKPMIIAQRGASYQYVRSDLKRTSATAGIVFLVLIVLYFALR